MENDLVFSFMVDERLCGKNSEMQRKFLSLTDEVEV